MRSPDTDRRPVASRRLYLYPGPVYLHLLYFIQPSHFTSLPGASDCAPGSPPPSLQQAVFGEEEEKKERITLWKCVWIYYGYFPFVWDFFFRGVGPIRRNHIHAVMDGPGISIDSTDRYNLLLSKISPLLTSPESHQQLAVELLSIWLATEMIRKGKTPSLARTSSTWQIVAWFKCAPHGPEQEDGNLSSLVRIHKSLIKVGIVAQKKGFLS